MALCSREKRAVSSYPTPEEAISKADDALKVHEGHAFEKMVKLIIEECSRKNKVDFSLTNLVKGYWNKPDGQDIELDLVAVNETDKILRVGSCKRSVAKHNNDNLLAFNGHIDQFNRTVLGGKSKIGELSVHSMRGCSAIIIEKLCRNLVMCARISLTSTGGLDDAGGLIAPANLLLFSAIAMRAASFCYLADCAGSLPDKT